jgi:hypothetical protein
LFLAVNDPIAIILRILSIIQLWSVLPILVYCARIQLFGTFFGNDYPSRLHVFIFAIAFISGGMLIIYFFIKYLDLVLSYIGASAGFVLIFFIPLCVNMVYYKLKHPESLKDINPTESGDTNQTISVLVTTDNKQIAGPGLSTKPFNEIKNYLFYASQVCLILFGLFVFIVQFAPINFFGIHIKE